RLLAPALGLAAALQLRALRRAGWNAVPGTPRALSDQGSDGRLPRGVRAAPPAAGAQRRAGGWAVTIRRTLPGDLRHAALPRPRGRGGDGGLPEAEDSGLRRGARSIDRPAAFERLQASGAVPAGDGAARRCGQLWRRDRDGAPAGRSPGGDG